MKHTIKDIAKLAGVSKATVSRVLNNSKPVSEDIRKRVMAVIEETQYQPSQVARSLINKETKLIGVIIPDVSNSVFSKIIQGVEEEAIKHGYNVLLCNSRYDEDVETAYLDILRDKEVDGLIYHGFKYSEAFEEKLHQLKKPTVMIGIGPMKREMPVIMIDNKKAAFEATQYLIELGHERIGMIHGPLDDPFAGGARYKGYCKALRESDLKVDEELIVGGHYKLRDGYEAMNHILEAEKLPTAVFCANDEMAIGAIKCTIDHGLKVPDDISFVGFDNIDIAGIYSPSVTTIAQPFREKGISAIQVLMKLINEETVAPKTVHEHKLVVRESTKELKKSI